MNHLSTDPGHSGPLKYNEWTTLIGYFTVLVAVQWMFSMTSLVQLSVLSGTLQILQWTSDLTKPDYGVFRSAREPRAIDLFLTGREVFVLMKFLWRILYNILLSYYYWERCSWLNKTHGNICAERNRTRKKPTLLSSSHPHFGDKRTEVGVNLLWALLG